MLGPNGRESPNRRVTLMAKITFYSGHRTHNPSTKAEGRQYRCPALQLDKSAILSSNQDREKEMLSQLMTGCQSLGDSLMMPKTNCAGMGLQRVPWGGKLGWGISHGLAEDESFSRDVHSAWHDKRSEPSARRLAHYQRPLQRHPKRLSCA